MRTIGLGFIINSLPNESTFFSYHNNKDGLCYDQVSSLCNDDGDALTVCLCVGILWTKKSAW